MTRLVTLREQELAEERARRDQNEFTPKELSRLAFDLIEHCPTFEQGRDRWVDFAPRMRIIFRRQNCPDDLAKEVLWIAIKGTPSRILVASMNPSQGAYESMTLDQYMAEMAGKFTPASESVYLKTEYKSRKQGKMEDMSATSARSLICTSLPTPTPTMVIYPTFTWKRRKESPIGM